MDKQIDSPLDSKIDLGLVNYVKHPKNPSYIVFRFKDENRAITFEEQLQIQKIWFEKSIENKINKKIYLFGIHKDKLKKVQQINFSTEAKHRNFIIKNNVARYSLLIVMGTIILLAIIGYIID